MLSARPFKLSLPLLLLAIAWPAAAQSGKPLQVALDEFPSLARSADGSRLVVFSAGMKGFPGSCSQLRVARLDELSSRWQPAVEQLTLASCEMGMPVISASYLSYTVNASFKPGTVQLQGLPVLGYSESGGAMHHAQSYTVDAPLPALRSALGPVIERECLPLHQRNPDAVPTCTLQQEGDSWLLLMGGVNRMIMLKPAADDPSRSQYVLSSSGGR